MLILFLSSIMKKISTLTLSILTCLFIFLACQRGANDLLPAPPPSSQEQDEMVQTNFQGRVVNENGIAVEGAIAKAGGKTALTDKYGIFRIAGVTTPRQFAFVSIEKEGYFKGSRTVIANTESANFVEIQLMRKTLAGK